MIKIFIWPNKIYIYIAITNFYYTKMILDFDRVLFLFYYLFIQIEIGKMNLFKETTNSIERKNA